MSNKPEYANDSEEVQAITELFVFFMESLKTVLKAHHNLDSCASINVMINAIATLMHHAITALDGIDAETKINVIQSLIDTLQEQIDRLKNFDPDGTDIISAIYNLREQIREPNNGL
jgi:hypothetical protein